jgi:hypothetical protein
MIDWAFALLLMHHRSPIDWAVTELVQEELAQEELA